MTRRRLHIAFVSAAAAWAALIVVAPFLASRAHASTFGAALTIAVYAVGRAVCHQLPERSFYLWTAQMPVCARCTGIYFGAAVMAVAAAAARLEPRLAPLKRRLAPLKRRLAPLKRRPTYATVPAANRSYVGHRFSGAVRGARLILAVAALPSAATLVFEWTTGVTPSNWIRFAAGVPIGVAVAWLVRAAAENQVN